MTDQKTRSAALTEGAEMPTLVKTPTPMQLFMFSAATWNRHLIHYNSEFAHADGLKNVAVHRALLGGFLAEALTGWLDGRGRIASLEWSVRGSAAIDQPVLCEGRVTEVFTADGKEYARCAVSVKNHEGATIVPGTAVLEISG